MLNDSNYVAISIETLGKKKENQWLLWPEDQGNEEVEYRIFLGRGLCMRP